MSQVNEEGCRKFRDKKATAANPVDQNRLKPCRGRMSSLYESWNSGSHSGNSANGKSAPITFRISRLISFALVLFVVASTVAFAQPAPDSVEAEQDEPIAEKVNDPTATLTQVQIKDIYTPAEYGTNAQPNTIQFRALLAIGPSDFIPFEQLIRPTDDCSALSTSRGHSAFVT
jgi:hypothetical protein